MRKKPEPFLVQKIEYHTGDGSGIEKRTPERVSVIGIHKGVTYHIDGIMNDRNCISAPASEQPDVIPVDPKSDLLKNVVISKATLPMGADIATAERHLKFFMDKKVPKLITYTSEDFKIKSVSPDGKTFAISNGISDAEKRLQIVHTPETGNGINLLQKTGNFYVQTVPTDKTLALLRNRRIVPENSNVSADSIAALNMHVASLQRQ